VSGDLIDKQRAFFLFDPDAACESETPFKIGTNFLYQWLQISSKDSAVFSRRFYETAARKWDEVASTNELLGRFRSSDETKPSAAAFELLVFSIFVICGYEPQELVAHRSGIAKKKTSEPDFFVRDSTGRRVLVEASVVFPADDSRKSKQKLRRYLHGTARHISTTGFVLNVVDGFEPGTGRPSPAQLAEALDAKLVRLDWRRVRAQFESGSEPEHLHVQFPNSDFNAVFWAIPMASEERVPKDRFVMPAESGWDRSGIKARRRMQHKRGQHSNYSEENVLAIASRDLFIDLGSREIARCFQSQDGSLIPVPMSGLIVVKDFDPLDVRRASASLWLRSGDEARQLIDNWEFSEVLVSAEQTVESKASSKQLSEELEQFSRMH